VSACARSRPTARGAAIRCLAALFGLALPLTALGTPAAAPPPVRNDNILTLYSDPGLTGRHFTYRAASQEVERQGFVAKSAASTGMWTLCEGGEVASRCQTVQGEARELKLSPRIVRPGLNALALYDQPGLKGRQVIYSFPADRPAPFHARSARTWGGPWSLCDRGFKNCQTLDGSLKRLDLVVAAVKPAPEAALPDPELLPAAAPPTPMRRAPPKVIPIAGHAKPAQRPPAIRPQRVRIAHAHAKPDRPAIVHVHASRPAPARSRSRHLLMPVRVHAKAHHGMLFRLFHSLRPARYERIARPAPHVRLINQIVDRHARRTHPGRRRTERRLQLAWGAGDPYLYEHAPAPSFRGPPPGW